MRYATIVDCCGFRIIGVSCSKCQDAILNDISDKTGMPTDVLTANIHSNTDGDYVEN